MSVSGMYVCVSGKYVIGIWYVCVCTQVYVHVCSRVCVYIPVCIYVDMCSGGACVCLCVYVWVVCVHVCACVFPRLLVK